MTTRTKKKRLSHPLFLWQKLAEPRKAQLFEKELSESADHRLAVITRPGRKRVLLEIACQSQAQARDLTTRFGGTSKQLPRDWWDQSAQVAKSKQIKIGRRLLIIGIGDPIAGVSVPGYNRLVIPAGAAFGTGDHATTAMSLRILERLTHEWKPGWSILDLGTGSGIVALAAKRFGAKRVIGIDNDPIAISVARENARLNNIGNVQFRIADAQTWKFPLTDIVTANLFSNLLVEILPKLIRTPWLILSGILRNQKTEISRALRHNDIEIVELRRRGKWIAILAEPQQNRFAHNQAGGYVCAP
jgi:ribosomal protein L11 methyltransferase